MANPDVEGDALSLSTILALDASDKLIKDFVESLKLSQDVTGFGDDFSPAPEVPARDAIDIGYAALNAFLQTNVTGPVLPANDVYRVKELFSSAWGTSNQTLSQACSRYLEVDGVTAYAYMPYPELFCLAKHIFTTFLADEEVDFHEPSGIKGSHNVSLAWTKLRINTWHYKLLMQPTLGRSNFNRSTQYSEYPSLVSRVINAVQEARKHVMEEDTWSTENRVQFLLEAANGYMILGRSDDAKAWIAEAAAASGFQYTLSGALGKKTKFQEKATSQLIVFAKSRGDADDQAVAPAKDETESLLKPDALTLNDDTLLEEIQFTKEAEGGVAKSEEMPSSLHDLEPDNQPQLSPLDQMVLLIEATMKDTFSPTDALTSEEILPYAVRVLADNSTNWQIYTQALLVRSRIELHRSRTIERGVLQLQAVADQVLTDITQPEPELQQGEGKTEGEAESDVPSIQITTPSSEVKKPAAEKIASFLPAPKPSESAPAAARLRYIHSLSSPPRWHLESELAYAWAGVGSLSSALEIFKRLRLWAEVALCLASAAAAEDHDGRGSGGEEKARGIIRWRLFHRSEGESPSNADDEDIEEVTALRAADFSGKERSPAPTDAPRLWCILGDLEDEPSHYERAWNISEKRYARAQKSLGEYYLSKGKDIARAREAYKKATSCNRLSPEMWGRLGDISLRMADFEEAAEAYSKSIGCANDEDGGDDARTWSNLGSSLWSLYLERAAAGEYKNGPVPAKEVADDDDDDDDDDAVKGESPHGPSSNPSKLLNRAMAAYKKGASLAHDNWKIWDNVLTLCTRIEPVPVMDVIIALNHIIRIRKTEDALDVKLLSVLLQDQVLSKEKPASVDEPLPRGSTERLVTRLLEEEVVPLITHRGDLWTVVSRLRSWKGDCSGAIEASTNAWRCATGSTNSGLLPNTGSSDGSKDWTLNKEAWDDVVQKTDELASMLENWGPNVETIGTKWKGRVRSAVRTVMSRGKESWEGNDGWQQLENIIEGLKA